MNKDATVGLIIIGGALALATMGADARDPKPTVQAVAKPMRGALASLYQKYGAMYGVDPALLRAIAMVESSENPVAVNPSDPSYGLMQVLCKSSCPTCKCQNKFNIDGWSEATPTRLIDPEFNVKLGAQILAWNIRTYGPRRGIAVYNNWGARNASPNGPFPNQSYVDKVERNLARVRVGQ